MDGMMESETQGFASLVDRLRAGFLTGKTRDITWRREQLNNLKRFFDENEKEIFATLKQDLRKPDMEIYSSEYDFVRKDIDHALKHLSSWMRPEKVSTPLSLLPAKSEIVREPYGISLIISAWNYPIQLLLAPLVGAIAAGNGAVLKPSEMAPATERLIAEKIPDYLDNDLFAVITGGVETMTKLLEIRFDHIFYTGSSHVGKIIMAAAAKFLTPVVLELGGKNVAVVLADADLAVTARRIVWGKFNNAGQLCVSPDYILVERSVEEKLHQELKQAVSQFFGNDPQQSADYGRIIHHRHFDRLVGFLDGQKIAVGGEHDREDKYIAPTILSGTRFSDPVMQDEIFGPILPVIGFDDLDGALGEAARLPTPLALYCFTKDKAKGDHVFEKIPSGSASLNDVVVFMANRNLPFGGLQTSGMGAYHGQHSFEAFSHKRAKLSRGFGGDVSIRYPPYGEKTIGLLRKMV